MFDSTISISQQMLSKFTTPEINPDEFEKLLLWLDRDRESAGKRYERIRLRLIKFFYARKCHSAEELADEMINRVTKKLPAF